ATYWNFIDEVWVKTPEYSGGGFGHLRRWTPKRLNHAREVLERAAAACKTPAEKNRVALASDSLEQFALFMKLRRALASGRFATLADESKIYAERMTALGQRHQAGFAFGGLPSTEPTTVHVRNFKSLYRATYEDAARIATGCDLLTYPPLREWH